MVKECDMTCRHDFFLQDFVSNEAQITTTVGKDWKIRCGHCNENIAGSFSGAAEPIFLRWTLSGTWFGEFEFLTFPSFRYAKVNIHGEQ